MEFLTLIDKFINTQRETIGAYNDAQLSYTGITTLTVNNTTYTDIVRVCIINRNDEIKLYITQYKNQKVTSILISDIETLNVVN